MDSGLHQSIILFCILLFIAGGCALKVQEEEVKALVQQARKTFDVIDRLPIHEIYVQDYQEAQSVLAHAESYLQENRYEQAYLAAGRSLAASRRILQDFYQNTHAQSAQETKAKIEEIAPQDPTQPLKDFIPTLKEMLDYSEELQIDQKIVDLLDAKQIEYATNLMLLASDVSFEPGEYKLSETGKHMLAEYCKDIIATKNNYHKLYPDKLIIIIIKVIGYTDQTAFREKTELLKKLTENVEGEVPQMQPKRRQFLNQRLSEFRAKTVSEYLAQLITEATPEGVKLQIEQKIGGLGEKVPLGVSPPYPIKDPRRRICKIYVSVRVQ